MTRERARDFGFAPAHDSPIPYLPRIREYYQALGYGAPYEWAHYADVPFRPLGKPLSRSRVAIVTTAAPYQPGKGDQGPRAPYNGAAKFYDVYSGDSSEDPDLRISHVAIDRAHTTGEDIGAYFPLAELRRRAVSGRIGSVAPRFHGAPTNRSHRTTLEVDCPEIVARLQADGADAAILVPNCPVCHQTVCLAARMLEENGISTVVMGCAKDIVEYVGVPRFLFSDFPLGNAAGRPERSRVSSSHPRPRAEPPRGGAGRAYDRSVSVEMERQPRLEARLLQHRAALAGRSPAPPRRVRRGKGTGEKRTRRVRAKARRGGRRERLTP